MDAAFRDYKSPPRPISPIAHSPSPANDEVINRRNEIQEAANKGKKKLATVYYFCLMYKVLIYFAKNHYLFYIKL